MSERKIGIIGGVGPYAGIDLNKRIFSVSKAKKDQDYPTVLLYTASSIPDRSEYLLDHRKPSPIPVIEKVIDLFESVAVTAFSIACNTAHSPVILNPLLENMEEKGYALRFIHMINETESFIQTSLPSIKRVGLLATLGTYHSAIYSHSLEKEGRIVLIPEDKVRVHSAIYSPLFGIKTSVPFHSQSITILQEEGMKLCKKGAEAIILGCTEISSAIDYLSFPVPKIDPIEILARTLVRSVFPEREQVI